MKKGLQGDPISGPSPISNLNKSEIRLQFLQLRNAFVAKESATLATFHVEMCERLRHLVLQLSSPPTIIASYRARHSEVPTCGFESINPPASWVYPKVEGQSLRFFKPKGFVRNRWGIEEPTGESPEIPLREIHMVLVPGLAFDLYGYRLGTGKGFYDRALAHYGGVKVGMAYTLQISSHRLPIESHDIPMEYIVTEKYTLKQINKVEKWKQQQ